MSIDAYTPGDWYLDRDDIEACYMILAPSTGVGKRLIAYVLFGFHEPAESEQHANARLLASSKNMAKALHATAAALMNSPNRYDTCNVDAREALAAAEAALEAAGWPLT